MGSKKGKPTVPDDSSRSSPISLHRSPKLSITTSLMKESSNESPKWLTVEFGVYYILVGIAAVSLFASAWSFSQESSPYFELYKHRLQPGWLGKWVDLSDHQQRLFRTNLGLLALLLFGFTLISQFFQYCAKKWAGMALSANSYPPILPIVSPETQQPVRSPLHRAALVRLDQLADAKPLKTPYQVRRIFLFISGSAFLFALHGSNALFIQAALLINWFIARLSRFRRFYNAIPWLTWFFALGSLYATNFIEEILVSNYIPFLSFLDTYFGFYKRWFVPYSMALLRMISYNLDLYDVAAWQYSKRSSYDALLESPARRHLHKCHECRESVPLGQLEPLCGCLRYRTLQRHSLSDYNFINFQAYALYIPIYLSGPIVTFNDFLYQMHTPLFGRLKTFTWTEICFYAVRFVFCFLLLEVLAHSLFVVAVKDAKAWKDFSTLQMFSLGYWNLTIVWLKLLIIWRFARLWAFVDGVYVPENMLRCMSNHYSALSFWRAWHASFNQWLLRYVYFPLGGRTYLPFNVWLVFGFVAFWHDRTAMLLMWAGLSVIFILPEILISAAASKYCPTLKKDRPLLFRLLKGALYAANVYFMCIGNIVGFVLKDKDEITQFLRKLFWIDSMNAAAFLILSYISIFSAVQIMFEIREHEKRRGIYRNY